MGIRTGSELDPEWSPDLDLDDLREVQAVQHDPSKIIAKLSKDSA